MFDIDCGATTPFNTQVSIAPAGKPFFADEYEPVFVVHGRHSLNPAWIDESTLEIHAPAGERIYRKEIDRGGIVIRYD
ncbi:MAG: hypothetical protein ACRED5_05945 [Propylenella sp.]